MFRIKCLGNKYKFENELFLENFRYDRLNVQINWVVVRVNIE